MGWSFELHATVGGQDVVWAHASITPDGIVQNPDVIGDHTINGRPVRLVGDGFSITDEMNQRMEAAYRRHSGHSINGYSAGFQQTNQVAFNRAHALAIERDLSPAEANIVAAAATPSGYVTVQRGFGDLEVEIQSGSPGTYRARAIMRRGPFPAALQPHLDAVRARMRQERQAPPSS